MVDALEYNYGIAMRTSKIIEKLGVTPGKFLAVTIHRPGNTDIKEHMVNILSALGESGKEIVFPAHPRTVNYLKGYGLLENLPSNVQIIEPLGYLDMLMLMGSADKVITDSGGVQKEAYMLKVPCITLRDNTEWVETIDSGWNVLVGANKELLLKMIHKPKEDLPHDDIFGRDATKKIADCLNLV